MRVIRVACVLTFGLLLCFGVVQAAEIRIEISGEGAIDSTTIKAGKPVSFDIMMENDAMRTGITFGFKLTSDEIKSIKHVADKKGGLTPDGDVKGHNGFEDSSIWDLTKVMVVRHDWDGKMPELIGFGALCRNEEYLEHKMERKLSFQVQFDEAGTIAIDSAFYPPGGRWMYASPPNTIPTHKPKWDGPFEFKVVE